MTQPDIFYYTSPRVTSSLLERLPLRLLWTLAPTEFPVAGGWRSLKERLLVQEMFTVGVFFFRCAKRSGPSLAFGYPPVRGTDTWNGPGGPPLTLA